MTRKSIGRKCTENITHRMANKAISNIKGYDKAKENESSKIAKWIDHSKIRYPRMSLLEAHNPEHNQKRFSLF